MLNSHFPFQFLDRESDAETSPTSQVLDGFKIPSDPLIATLTIPMLFGLVGGKAIADGLQSLGQASEEIFRGDRLRVVHFPLETDSDPQP